MKKAIIIIISAVLTALPLLFGNLPLLAWFSLVPFIYILFEETEKGTGARKVWLYGLLWSFCYYFVIYQWFIYLYPLEVLGVNKLEAAAIIALCWIGLATLQAFGRSLLALFFRLLRPTGIWRIFIVAAIWTAFEWLQSYTWLGVPWARLALSQAPWRALIQSASLFGSLFVSFIIVLVNAMLALAYAHYKKGGIKAKGVRVWSLVCLSLFSANLLFGVLAIALHTEDEERKVKAALIQPNIPTVQKWGESYESPLDLSVDMSMEAAKDGDIDIIVWSETVINYNLLKSFFSTSQVKKLAKDTGAVVCAGAFDRIYDKEDSSKYDDYNAVITFYPDGSISEKPYYKRHLVPFGEYVPMKSITTLLLPPLADMNAYGGDLTPGTDTAVSQTEYGGLGMLVCFDSIYQDLARESVADGAEILILSTNDAWYKDSAAARQHNYHAVLRAVENGRWLLRSANTGISSIISSTGEITESLGALEKGSVVGEAYFSSERTLYSYIGDTFSVLCFVFAIGFAGYRIVLKIKNRKKDKVVPE